MKLDYQQALAVTTDSEKALVLAGAGSGKTRVLTERIVHLIEKQRVSPYEILAFTFTRKAAGEMVGRLKTRIGNEAKKCTLGTMHAIALMQIQRFGEHIGLRHGTSTVYCQWESEFLLREVAKETSVYKNGKWDPAKKVIDAMFADYYERGIAPDEFHEGFQLFVTFIDWCQQNNALTYGALLIGLELLIPTLAKHLHWKHILVDEVQDIDPLQWRIINALCEAFGARLFTVGDIDQSIFEFRGAVPQYLVDHQKEFDIYKIEHNYRSDGHVVNAANKLISHNKDRLEKTMVAFEDAQTPIEVVKNATSKDIVKVYAALNEKSPKTNRAILSSRHYLLIKTAQLLTEAKIPHAYIGRKAALANSEHFRRFHAFLKLIVNPYDNFSFLLIKDLIGAKDEYRKIKDLAIQKGMSHFQAWIEYGKYSDWDDFFKDIDDFNLESQAETLHLMLDREGFEPTLLFIHEWCRYHPEGFLLKYLNWLATYDIQDELEQETANLQLMTIYAAKGLEWPTVIIAGLNEKILPGKQAIEHDEIEAERRLAYVAWTRACDKLILTVRPIVREDNSGRLHKSPQSRFVKESI